MAATPEHTYQILTKRPARMRSFLANSDRGLTDAVDTAMGEFTRAPLDEWPLPNVWLGVSVENQKWADIRLPLLWDTPAAVRWISAEPLLGPVTLPFITEVDACTCYGGNTVYGHEPRCGIEPGPAWGNLHWVVAGGESGPGSRPMQPTWTQSLRDQCAVAGVPFFFKQWGEWVPPSHMTEDVFMSWDVDNGTSAYDHDQPWRVGKKRAGRLLDGRTHDEYPTEVGA